MLRILQIKPDSESTLGVARVAAAAAATTTGATETAAAALTTTPKGL